jgi:SAM-dependent methyltransferase
MHREVKSFVKQVRKETRSKYWMRSFFRNKKVLEVGSHNINGSPRQYFWFCDYTGVDISNGKGVDIVGRFSEIEFNDKYDVVISTEMLEHDSDWENSLQKMYQLLKAGGLLIITCAALDREEHGTKRTTPQLSPDTTDYYRNISKEDFRGILSRGLFSNYLLQYARGENDLQFYGIKKQ